MNATSDLLFLNIKVEVVNIDPLLWGDIINIRLNFRSKMDNSKPFYLSTTLIGAAVMLVSLVLKQLGVEVLEPEVEQAIVNLVGVVGFVLVVLGRLKAKQKLTL